MPNLKLTRSAATDKLEILRGSATDKLDLVQAKSDGSPCCCGNNCGSACLPTPGAAVLGAGSVHEGFASFPATSGWLDITDQISGGQYIEQRDYGPTHIDYGPQKLEIQLSRSSETSSTTTAIMRVAYLTKGDGTVVVAPPNLTVTISTFASARFNMRIGTNAWPSTGIACSTGLKTRNFINSYLTNPAAGTELYKISVPDVDMHRFTVLSSAASLTEPVKRPDQWTGTVLATLDIAYPNGEDLLITSIPPLEVLITPGMLPGITVTVPTTIFVYLTYTSDSFRDEPEQFAAIGAYTSSHGITGLFVTPHDVITGEHDIPVTVTINSFGNVLTYEDVISGAVIRAINPAPLTFDRKTVPYRHEPRTSALINAKLLPPYASYSQTFSAPAFDPAIPGATGTVTTDIIVLDSAGGTQIGSLQILDDFLGVGAEDVGLIRLPGEQIVENNGSFCGKLVDRWERHTQSMFTTTAPYGGFDEVKGSSGGYVVCAKFTNISYENPVGTPIAVNYGKWFFIGTPVFSFDDVAKTWTFSATIADGNVSSSIRFAVTASGGIGDIVSQTLTGGPWAQVTSATLEVHVFASVMVRGDYLQAPLRLTTRPSPDIRVANLAEVCAFSNIMGHTSYPGYVRRVPPEATQTFTFTPSGYNVPGGVTPFGHWTSYVTFEFYSWTQIFTPNSGSAPNIWDNNVMASVALSPTPSAPGAVQKVRCNGDQVVVESTLENMKTNPPPEPNLTEDFYARNAISGYHPEADLLGVAVEQSWNGGIPGGDQSTLTYDLP